MDESITRVGHHCGPFIIYPVFLLMELQGTALRAGVSAGLMAIIEALPVTYDPALWRTH
jgi:hypothetical protein